MTSSHLILSFVIELISECVFKERKRKKRLKVFEDLMIESSSIICQLFDFKNCYIASRLQFYCLYYEINHSYFSGLCILEEIMYT